MRTTIPILAVLWLAASSAGAQAPAAAPEPQQDRGTESPAVLERPHPDQGYYFTAGLHLANVNVLDGGDWVSGLSGYAMSFRIGQSLRRFFDLGFRVDDGSVIPGDRSGIMGSFGLDATLRPSGPWLFRLGGGMGGADLSSAPDSDDDAGTFGAIAALEVGYNLHPFYDQGDSGSFTLTPILRMTSVQPFTDDSAYWAMIGIELTWWTGLPKHQLDLTLEEAFPER